LENCFISEITVAELKFGAEKSQKVVRNRLVVSTFISQMNILPIYSSLDSYAQEKNRLQKQGTPIDEFDLLIGATALANDLVLVTNNTKHFKRLTDIQIEDWTQKV
jgi:tRNA(fMet)-specific endonuclease VapC